MMEIPLTQHLAAFCTRLKYDSLPAEVVDRAKYFFSRLSRCCGAWLAV